MSDGLSDRPRRVPGRVSCACGDTSCESAWPEGARAPQSLLVVPVSCRGRAPWEAWGPGSAPAQRVSPGPAPPPAPHPPGRPAPTGPLVNTGTCPLGLGGAVSSAASPRHSHDHLTAARPSLLSPPRTGARLPLPPGAPPAERPEPRARGRAVVRVRGSASRTGMQGRRRHGEEGGLAVGPVGEETRETSDREQVSK